MQQFARTMERPWRGLFAVWRQRSHCLLCGASLGPGAATHLCSGCNGHLPAMGKNVCPQCSAVSPSGQRCGDCLAHERRFDAAVAAFHYAFPVDQVIGQLKYGSRLALASWLGQSLAHAVQQCNAAQVDFIVPLPLSRERLAERGFNQSGLIAVELSRKLGLTVQREILQRVRHTSPQAALDWKARVRNMRGAFATSADLQGARIALVDDVMTTGATLDAAARALKEAGAAEVRAWVVARADRTHLPAVADAAAGELSQEIEAD